MSDRIFSEYFRDILKDMGIDGSEQSTPFLFPEIAHLGDPFLFKEMETVCELIKKTILKKEKVFIYADGDMDGISGAAILSGFFEIIGVDFDVKLTHRLEEYEIEKGFIEQVIKTGYSILFIIDSGTSSTEALDYCESKSISTIVIDHHLANHQYKFSHIHFINPHIDKNDLYKNLTSAGLTLKLLQALKSYLSFFPKEYFISAIELAALGTLNDYVPLTGENRTIVKIGLNLLETSNILGLKLFRKYFYVPDRAGEIETVTFFFNPKLNAPGRFGKPEITFKLLTSKDPDECGIALKEIDTLTKKKQKIVKDTYLRIPLRDENYSFVILDDIPVSFSGIVASHVADKNKKPAFVGIICGDTVQGSARSYDMVNLHGFFSRDKDIFLSFGGHKNAVGFKFKKENTNKIKELWQSMEVETSTVAKGKIYDISVDTLGVDFIKEVHLLKPFGNGHPEILFRSKSVKIAKICRKEKGKTIVWIKQNNVLFEAHFPDDKFSLTSDIVIVYFPKMKQMNNDFFMMWLDIKQYC